MLMGRASCKWGWKMLCLVLYIDRTPKDFKRQVSQEIVLKESVQNQQGMSTHKVHKQNWKQPRWKGRKHKKERMMIWFEGETTFKIVAWQDPAKPLLAPNDNRAWIQAIIHSTLVPCGVNENHLEQTVFYLYLYFIFHCFTGYWSPAVIEHHN